MGGGHDMFSGGFNV